MWEVSNKRQEPIGGAAEKNGVQVGADGHNSTDLQCIVVAQEPRSLQTGQNNNRTRTTHWKAHETEQPKEKWKSHTAAMTTRVAQAGTTLSRQVTRTRMTADTCRGAHTVTVARVSG